jgi:hypothetical protein
VAFLDMVRCNCIGTEQRKNCTLLIGQRQRSRFFGVDNQKNINWGCDLLNSTRGRQLQLRARGCILFASGSNSLGQFSFVASGLSVPVGDLTL